MAGSSQERRVLVLAGLVCALTTLGAKVVCRTVLVFPHKLPGASQPRRLGMRLRGLSPASYFHLSGDVMVLISVINVLFLTFC